jgi:hypothetical protein
MRRPSFLLIVLLCAPLAAFAQFGGIVKGIAKGSPSDSGGGDVNALLQKIEAVAADFTAASDKLLEAYVASVDIYVSQEKKNELEQKITQIKKIEKPDQRAKETADLMIEMNKILEAVSEQQVQQKKLSDQQKTDVGRMSNNVALAVVKDKDCVDKAKELAPKSQAAAKDIGNDPQKAPQARKLTAATASLQAIAESGPRQITAAQGIVKMLAGARKANGIPDPPEAQTSGEFK